MPRIYSRQSNYVTKETTTKGTLCWYCQKATNSGCNWSRAFKPVKDWVATPTIINQGVRTQGEGPSFTESFFVHKCPEFKAIPPKKKQIKKKWFER